MQYTGRTSPGMRLSRLPGGFSRQTRNREKKILYKCSSNTSQLSCCLAPLELVSVDPCLDAADDAPTPPSPRELVSVERCLDAANDAPTPTPPLELVSVERCFTMNETFPINLLLTARQIHAVNGEKRGHAFRGSE